MTKLLAHQEGCCQRCCCFAELESVLETTHAGTIVMPKAHVAFMAAFAPGTNFCGAHLFMQKAKEQNLCFHTKTTETSVAPQVQPALGFSLHAIWVLSKALGVGIFD